MTSGRSHRPSHRTEIGWREIIGLPDLDIPSLKAKVDTGARTSALHAMDVEPVIRDGADWVAFSVASPGRRTPIRCSAPVADRRAIRNTSGVADTRFIIETTLVLGRRHWHIELSLSDRSEMEFDLILGREAIRGHGLLVNPGRSFLLDQPVATPAASRSRFVPKREPALEGAPAAPGYGEEE